MKVSNISEILIYVMTSILIVFFILIFGKIISGGFNNIEYFTEESYNGVIRVNSKMGDEVLISPKMDLSGNMVSPVSFKIMSEDNSESSMFKIDSSGVVTLMKDVSGSVSVGNSFTTKVVATDASTNTVEAELIIDVSDVVSTFINPVEKNEKVGKANYSDMNNTLNSLLSNINKGMSQLSLANSNNIGGDDESDDIVESFTNQKGGYYYL
jgi:hypothetical protein